MIITILLLLIFTLLLYNYYVHHRKKGQFINSLPGPTHYPIFGSILQCPVLGTPEELWKFLDTLTDQYYSIFKLWAFFLPIVSIRHPDDLKTILSSTKHTEKSFIYDILRPWLGNGLLISGECEEFSDLQSTELEVQHKKRKRKPNLKYTNNYISSEDEDQENFDSLQPPSKLYKPCSKWHSRRKILTPTFHFDILQQFVETLFEEGENMTKSLKDMEGTVVEDLLSFVSEHTLNAICDDHSLINAFSETAMGTSLKDLGVFQQQYRNAVHRMGKLFTYRFVRQWLHNDFIFSLTPKGREQTKCLKILHGFSEQIIAQRKLYHERTNGRHLKSFDNDISAEADETEMIGIKKKRLALLDLLIAASQDGLLTDLDIREEIDVFMFAGHDTSALAISYLLLLLAEHKEIQDRVRNEVDTVMQENGGKFSIKSLQDLSYLDRCIKETLRLYPSAFLISRVTGEDVKLQSYLIPAGTVLFLNIYKVHRDPNFWPNPEIFDPDRFLPEKIRNRHPYSYIPFSAGPRNCIGQRFALLQMKAIIARLIHNFYLEPIDYLKNLRLQIDFVLRPATSFRLKFMPRQ